MVKKSVTLTRKKELEQPDKFMVFSKKLIEFGTKHKTRLSIGLGVVLTLILAFLGFRYYGNRVENDASALWKKSVTNYYAIAKEQSPDEAYHEVEKDFLLLTGKYSGTVRPLWVRISTMIGYR